jgi:hypothetical protein
MAISPEDDTRAATSSMLERRSVVQNSFKPFSWEAAFGFRRVMLRWRK